MLGGQLAAPWRQARGWAWPQVAQVAPLVQLGLGVLVFYAPQLASGTTQFDGVDVHYSAQRYLSDAIRSGQLPFWTPYLFSGFPFLADVQVGAWYPLNWPFLLVGIGPRSIGAELLLHSLIACGGAYALARRWIGPPLAAVAAGLFYGLSGYFAAHSQHLGMVQTAAWLPWLILLLDHLGERLSARRLGLAALLGAALALPGHFQTALYAGCGAALWAALEALTRRDVAYGRRVLLGVLGVGIGGALLGAVMILPGWELAQWSVRTRLDALTLGGDIGYFHLDSLRTLVQPDAYGLLSGHYSGPGDRTQHYFYAGLLLVPLAVLGLTQARVRRAAAFLGLPFLWYAVGPAGGLYRLVARLPGFHSIELPMHGWFLPALGLALLGGAGLGELQRRGPRLLRAAWLPTVLLGLLTLDLLVVNELSNPLAYARASFDSLYGSALRTFQAQVEAAQPPLQRLDGPELAAVGYRNHALQSHVETTYGYNPLELAAYADYIAAAASNPRLIDGLAATHDLVSTSDQTAVELRPRPGGLPLVFFARSVLAAEDDAAAQAALGTLDPARQTLVVGRPGEVAAGLDPTASATVIQRGDDTLVVHVRTASPGLLRVAIPFYPGWSASLTGVPLQVLSVDRALLGVVVPAGEGDLQVHYVPRLFGLGAAISGLALLAVLGVLFGPALGRRWPRH